jgi:heme exporter protein CcmB
VALFRQAALVFWKDVVVELRSGEVLYPSLLFAVIVVLLCSFAFVQRGTIEPTSAAGILWITVSLAGTLALGRAFEREREGDTLRGLLLTPAPRAAIYLGKVASTAATLVVLAAAVVPLVLLLMSVPLSDSAGVLGPMGLLVLLGAVGFGAVGALFGAALLRARGRDVLLSVITYPLLVPVLIAGVKGTVALLPGGDVAETWFWIRFLVVYDVTFLVVGLWVFDPLAAE